LDLVERHKVEALFSGHVHHFWYNRYAQADWYLLPSTSFTRQDYSELFRDAPTTDMQAGRNDADKLGYFVVFVYEHGHVCHLRRTHGVLLPKVGKIPDSPKRIATYHSREAPNAVLGFEMRHPWAELTEIAPSGALDEFHRKEIRNDYPLLALWDMGVRKIRIPLQDLESSHVLERVRALKHHGHAFTVISQGIPNTQQRHSLISNAELIDRWEVTLRIDRVAGALSEIRTIGREVSFPIFLSKLRLKEDVVRDGEPYYHLISHGFVTDDFDEIFRLKDQAGFDDGFSGLVFRVGRGERPWERIPEFDNLARGFGIGASATVFMADPNPALSQCDDLANANRIAEALLAAACSETDVFVDTFMDLDRGHSVRNGVIDRRFNPRLGLHVTRNLHGAVNGFFEGPIPIGNGDSAGGRWISVSVAGQIFALVMPNSSNARFALELTGSPSGPSGIATRIDLSNGAITDLVWHRSGGAISVESESTPPGPVLIAFN
jgi:hypothetical protein